MRLRRGRPGRALRRRSSSPPAAVPFVPPFENLAPTEPAHGTGYKDGVFVFRTLDDCERMLARAADAKSAAVIGGGLLGLEAARGLLEPRPRGPRRPPDGAPDGDAARSRRRADAAERSMEQLGRARCTSASRRPAVLGNGAVDRPAVRGRLDASTCDLRGHRRRHPPERRAGAVDAGLTVERGIVVDDGMATSDPSICAVGECARAPRPGLRPGRAAVGADARCWPIG